MEIALPKRRAGSGLLLVALGLVLSGTMAAAALLVDPLLASVAVIAAVAGWLIILRPELGVLLLFASVLFKYPEPLQGVGGIGINNFVRLALAMVLLATLTVRRQFAFLQSRQVQLLAVIGVLVFANWFVIGRLEAPTNLRTLDTSARSLEHAFTQLTFTAFMVSFVRTRRQLLAVIGVFLLGIFLTIPGALTNAYTVLQAAATKVQRAHAGAYGVHSAENANRLAFLSVISIPLLWYAMLEYRRRLLYVLGGLVIVLLVVTIFATGSRSGVLELALLPLLMVAQRGLSRAQFVAIVLLVALASGLAYSVASQSTLDRLGTLFPTEGSGEAATSLARRTMLVEAGLKLFGANPFLGVGVGNFRWLTATDPEFGGLSGAAHNAYLLALVEGGMVLLAAYLLLFWFTLRDLGKALVWSQQVPGLRLGWLIRAFQAHLLLLLVFSFSAEAWKEFHFDLIIGGAAVVTHLSRQAAERAWPRSQSPT